MMAVIKAVNVSHSPSTADEIPIQWLNDTFDGPIQERDYTVNDMVAAFQAGAARRGCDHMFPERGIGCPTCDEYHWHEDDRNMHELDDRLARIEGAVFPLEDSRRIWVAEARLPYMVNDRIPVADKVTVTGPYRAGDHA